ncbi:hypothetical protein RJ640_020453, partial [Escallonia rubra]
MESSSLPSLPEENHADNDNNNSSNVPSPSSSAFFSIPHRPPSTLASSNKYSPLNWSDYYDREDDVCIPNSDNVFHVYMAGTEGPVVFCLHGGGFSGYVKRELKGRPSAQHAQAAAGFGGLSFSLSAKIIKEKARVVAMDLRGHGKSSTENELDLSIETLCSDVLAVLKTMYGDSPPAIVLVGHSLGGSVAVHVAAKKALPSLAGLVVVDVVEGTAMASLIHMQKILSNRMQYFPTIEKAVEWSVKGGSTRNIESARVSIPSTLTYDDSKKCHCFIPCQLHTHSTIGGNGTILERLQTPRSTVPAQQDGPIGGVYEQGPAAVGGARYEGLSEKFLSSPVPKLLLLAGTDRLDRALTIGQMQGKFQMVVVRHTGHAIQEDVPDEFASLVLNFISRNRIGPRGVE